MKAPLLIAVMGTLSFVGFTAAALGSALGWHSAQVFLMGAACGALPVGIFTWLITFSYASTAKREQNQK